MARWVQIAAVVLGLCGSSHAMATEGDPAVRIKENLLYHLLRMVTWPAASFATSSTPVTMCFVGESVLPIAQLAQRRSSRPATRNANPGQRAFVVRTLASSAVAEGDEVDIQRRLAGCHAVYLGSDLPRIGFVSRALSGLPVLTLGDGAPFAARHGIIGFVRKDRRIRLHVNRVRASESGLQLGARLLQHATLVEPER